MILVSPAEPASMKGALDRAAVDMSTGERIPWATDAAVERRGVDFLWRAQGQWWGLQRKELADFLASLDDGRLAKEIAQMRSFIAMPYIALEGRVVATREGMVTTASWKRPISIQSLWKRVLSIQYQGVAVQQVTTKHDTALLVVTAYLWSQNADHMTATTRPKPPGEWGSRNSDDYMAWWLQAIDTIGVKKAWAAVEYCRQVGKHLIVLNMTPDEMLETPGWGEGTVEAVTKMFAKGVDGG